MSATSWAQSAAERSSRDTSRVGSAARGALNRARSAFLSSGSPQEPLAEFAAADDYEHTRELIAVIRGSDGGRRMYSAGDTLPAAYADRFRTQLYNERIVYPGAWNKVVVVAREDDDETMLNHALIQSRRRDRG